MVFVLENTEFNVTVVNIAHRPGDILYSLELICCSNLDDNSVLSLQPALRVIQRSRGAVRIQRSLPRIP